MSLQLAGFPLQGGQYEEGRLWSEELGGSKRQLRCFDQAGSLILTPQEEAQQQLQEAQKQLA
ncbi:MAG: hypothetical protein Q6L58_09865 [Thermostichales cyanobacterium BF3_bins_165]